MIQNLSILNPQTPRFVNAQRPSARFQNATWPSSSFPDKLCSVRPTLGNFIPPNMEWVDKGTQRVGEVHKLSCGVKPEVLRMTRRPGGTCIAWEPETSSCLVFLGDFSNAFTGDIVFMTNEMQPLKPFKLSERDVK